MAKRKKVPKKKSTVDRFALIEVALRKQTKAELVDLLMATARQHEDVGRELESQLNIDKPVELLLTDAKSAIGRATDFDARMVNHNFDVDWQAYEEVKQGFKKLIKNGQIDEVKSLALELLKRGSYQVECSDEGMMSDDIEACLGPVIRAVKAGEAADAKSWATAMIAADRVGFICDNELKKLVGKEKK